MPELLFGDFETRSPVDIKKCGADVYARHPKTRVMAFGYAFDNEDVLVSRIGEMPEPAVIDHIAQGKPFIAHNAHFEWIIWNEVWRKEFPELPELKIEQCICTMSMAYIMALPGSLEFAAAAAGLDMKKDNQGARVMLQLARPKSAIDDTFWEYNEVPQKFEHMYQYCGQDVLVERGLYKRLSKISFKEKLIWDLDHKINQRGVQIDLLAVKNAIRLAEYEKERLDAEIRRVTGNTVATCSAVSQITEWLKFKGVECEGIAKNNVAELLEREDLPEDCRQALLLRQEAGKSSVAKLSAMLKGVCEDGRSRGLFQYHGAATGRWAGRRIQLQNLPRQKLPENEINTILDMIRDIN